MTHEITAEEQKGIDKLRQKIATLFGPLQREMLIMSWDPEIQALMWNAVALEAADRHFAAMEKVAAAAKKEAGL